jgi:hypothetical protein
LERVLTDFACEHSLKHAAARVLEHYGFEINVSAVREATLEHAQRAEQILQKEYDQPYRAFPAQGAQFVVAEADGRMVCTVARWIEVFHNLFDTSQLLNSQQRVAVQFYACIHPENKQSY